MRKADFTGKRIGRLTVIGEAGRSLSSGAIIWHCRCDCGNDHYVTSANLKTGRVNSCGCIHKEQLSQSRRIHGQKGTRLYSVWQSMKQRCQNPHNKRYKDYGGRGTSVCGEWNNFQNFFEWAMQSGYDAEAKRGDCTIDRIDNDGNYEPSNCRWVGMSIQNKNKQRDRKGV